MRFQKQEKNKKMANEKHKISGKRSGPPPLRGPNPNVPPVKLMLGGCPYRESNGKNMYPGHNGIQVKGFKFTGVK